MHNRGTCVVPFFNNTREQNVLEKEELQRLIWRVSLIMSIVTLRIEYMKFKKKKKYVKPCILISTPSVRFQ